MPDDPSQLALWGALATDGQRMFVRRLVEYAAPLLDRVYETFPTYTLHNSEHARNVAGNIAELLGPRLSELLPIEAALLILAAYYHDIGMVFSEEERHHLTADPEWNEFLKKNPEAFLEWSNAAEGTVPVEIAEWFCRWRHADRVYVHLQRLMRESPEKLKWGAVSVLEILGELCLSHGKKVSELQANRELTVDGLDEADLRFCAILLRLGDILDFDGSRSPESVYRYLGLNRRDTPRKTSSDVEWQKHLSSDGIRFPAIRGKRYELRFSAGPDHPAVEYDVRQFLAEIEQELEQCAALLPACSDRWRDLDLPATIDRDNIKSNGYRYGEYRFTLDQDHVLQLLMGESLYGSPYVFVRELLQNAIDATRLRAHLERASGHAAFKPQPIRVSEWTDPEQFHWVRFDDEGTGMDEQIIRDHLLKVGASYYGSAQFMADVLRTTEPGATRFVPISRFGIGLLSCFIACDRIEISTLRRAPPGQRYKAIRLSLDGLRGFFELRTDPLVPTLMPSDGRDRAAGSEYRTTPGTSIACRLDPTKEQGAFRLREILSRYLLAPPVPVQFEGGAIGGDVASILGEQWVEPCVMTMDEDTAAALSSRLGIDLPQDTFSVTIKFIDLSKYSPVPELTGGLVWARMSVREDLADLFGVYGSGAPVRPELRAGRSPRIEFSYATDYDQPFSFSINLSLNLSFDRDRPLDRLTPQQRDWLTKLGQLTLGQTSEFDSSVTLIADDVVRNKTVQALFGQQEGPLLLSHNGLQIPPPDRRYSPSDSALNLPGGANWAALCLSDRLRPDLSISRDELRGLPWEVHSALALALRRALIEEGLDPRALVNLHPLRELKVSEYLSLRRLAEDPLLEEPKQWQSEPLFTLVDSMQVCTLTQVLSQVAAGNKVSLVGSWAYSAPYIGAGDAGPSICAAATLAHRWLDMALVPDRDDEDLQVNGPRRRPLSPGELMFAPMTFLPFHGSHLLRSRSGLLNPNHPFAAWLLEKAPDLGKRLPGVMRAIRTRLLNPNIFSFEPREAVEALTEVLDRLSQLAPDLRLAKALYPTAADFE